jgi:hypothetical protein
MQASRRQNAQVSSPRYTAQNHKVVMSNSQVPKDVERRAEELVKVVCEIKDLESRAEDLKWEIDRDAEGGIEVNGGRIVYRNPTHFEKLDRDRLKRELRTEHNLSEEEIEELFEVATEEGLRQPTVVVYLNS